MKSRLDQLPVFDRRHTNIQAEHFNLVQIALKRLGNPIRFAIPKLRTLDFYIENNAWAVIDRALNDIPIIAWMDFATHSRESLHAPIKCEQRSYHIHANLIIDKAFEAMHLILGEMLDERYPGSCDAATPIQGKR